MNFNLFKKNILFRTMETPMETLTIDGGGKWIRLCTCTMLMAYKPGEISIIPHQWGTGPSSFFFFLIRQITIYCVIL
jgi:hypothetical protein